ncbi:hypothetical protein [Noviherbaspirillum autotrophicum]|uniref:Uncharacterized protein n=1 Tax=Noviherbaspirillum autotrophicum TaxID=709839 RepID=A0A0C2BQT6_9BURK|nr:hypothetical protein [Noviherbaspirillum autotrophicum]KIF80391.1 hypothetical protein TSA66_05465 [Noviherbaspirillum autotrophicum]
MDFFPNSQLGEPASVNASAFQKDFIALFQMQPNVTAPAEGVFASKGVFSCNGGAKGNGRGMSKACLLTHAKKLPIQQLKFIIFAKLSGKHGEFMGWIIAESLITGSLLSIGSD